MARTPGKSHAIHATYGLRWDINPPLKGKNLANDPFTVTGLNNPATLAWRRVALRSTRRPMAMLRPGWDSLTNSAIEPNWTSVLRGGVGIFYDLGLRLAGRRLQLFSIQRQLIFCRRRHRFRYVPQAPSLQSRITNPPVSTILVADPNLKLPRTYQWNVALEQSLRKQPKFVSHLHRRPWARLASRNPILLIANPNFRSVELTDNSATSDYNALQVKFQRRLSRGLQALGVVHVLALDRYRFDRCVCELPQHAELVA